MKPRPYNAFNPATDLLLERIVDVPPEWVWEAWTNPKHVVHWFTPKPWQTVECEIDLWPGGMFHTVMQSPEGQKFPNDGCYLDLVENRKLVFTSALAPGYRPTSPVNTPGLAFTAIVTMEPHGKGGCKYIAHAMHSNEADNKTHADMGFLNGWGTVLDQLVAYMKTQKK